MLYWLTELSDGGDVFNLFRYITFRSGGAFMTALVFGFLVIGHDISTFRSRFHEGKSDSVSLKVGLRTAWSKRLLD